jgi:hypothetical protein
LANFPCERRVGIRKHLDASAWVTGYNRTLGDRLDTEVVLLEASEPEHVAGQHQINDLAAAIKPDHASSRSAGYDAIPMVGPLALTADFLAAVEWRK